MESKVEIAIDTKRKAWLHAIRFRTLPLALASILMGSFIAGYHGLFRWEVFVLASLTTIFLQILSNLANDYGDNVHGADNEDRMGPVRAVQSGIIRPGEMKRAMKLLAILSFVSGILLLYVALLNMYVFFLFIVLGLLSIWAAIAYTSGSRPYGYMGLGDLAVFLFFGLTGVMGTYYLHGNQVSLHLILPAVSLGFFSTSVLNINNIRDIESDKKAGKNSIPVRIGRKAAVRYNWILVIAGNLSILLFLGIESTWGGVSALAVSPIMFYVANQVSKKRNAGDLDPYLKKMAVSTLFWVIAFGLGLLLLS